MNEIIQFQNIVDVNVATPAMNRTILLELRQAPLNKDGFPIAKIRARGRIQAFVPTQGYTFQSNATTLPMSSKPGERIWNLTSSKH